MNVKLINKGFLCFTVISSIIVNDYLKKKGLS